MTSRVPSKGSRGRRWSIVNASLGVAAETAAVVAYLLALALATLLLGWVFR